MVKVKGELPRASRRTFPDWVIGAVALIFVASLFALSFLVPSMAQAPISNAGSPPFANPSEIHYRDGEKRLRGVMKIISGTYLIPNVGTETLRQYRGWDPAQPEPTPSTKPGPGPTLRARLGDQVQISFLNKIDDSQFAYTFDTEPKPGLSSFGCDRSGTFDAKTGTYLPYPGNDVFPNCFHGSSTANIHFHGTHTSPDGLGDNVLVQVLPQTKQPSDQEPWLTIFDKNIFNSTTIPQKWMDMPPVYRQQQEAAISQRDTDAAAAAKKNGLPKPESLSAKNQGMIASGQWPQYIMGAFPNFFDIPDYDAVPGKYKAGQAPGTHWYHAHKHGSTSLHIRNGLAGAFIIESNRDGGYDHFIRKTFGWGTSYDNHEKILVFQQYDATQNLERAVAVVPPAGKGGTGSIQVLVNGQFTPTITMSPGEVQLWRLVNATEGNLNGVINVGVFTPAGTHTGLFLTTAGFTFMQSAQDGVQFSQTNYKNQPFLNSSPTSVPGGLVLAAANRADLLVQAPITPGVVAFKNAKSGVILFYVNVTGAAVTMPAIPTTNWAEMPKFLNDLPAPPVKDVANLLQFQWEPGRAGAGRAPTFPPHFMVNGKQFGATGEIVDQCMPQDGLQDWILENYTKPAAHPFHIHINPFQVIQIDTPVQPDKTKPPGYSSYAPTDNFVWQDVVAIPPAIITVVPGQPAQIMPGRVRIRHTFVDFTGTYVLHCHILAHEDRGMMQLVRVIPASNYPNGCQSAIPAHH
jgi:FtsP/CotA-like multicopper oxidase with cupredoxin domain